MSENNPNDSKGFSEALKKIFTVGASAAFLTEESIKSYLGDLKIPKEILNTILSAAGKGKDEIVGVVSKEISGLISKVDWVKELSKFAEEHKFKISAEIEVISKKKSNPE